jgi:four helix bundle protein
MEADVMQRFTKLRVWERSHAFALAIYHETETFPRKELFGVTSQIRRAAVSVPCNIAEGSKRRHRPDYARFLNFAEASIAEVEALLMICKDLGYLAPARVNQLLEEADAIARMASVLRQAVESAARREFRASTSPP